ncbi:hypothetical protein ACWEOG_22125 [Amycolatopsis japonica]
MKNHADFYVGFGEEAEWLGSVAYHGTPLELSIPLYPERRTVDFFSPGGVADYRTQVTHVLNGMSTAEECLIASPSDGWPWLRENSGRWWAYTCDETGRVFASARGGPWFVPLPCASIDGGASVAEGPPAALPVVRRAPALETDAETMVFLDIAELRDRRASDAPDSSPVPFPAMRYRVGRWMARYVEEVVGKQAPLEDLGYAGLGIFLRMLHPRDPSGHHRLPGHADTAYQEAVHSVQLLRHADAAARRGDREGAFDFCYRACATALVALAGRRSGARG